MLYCPRAIPSRSGLQPFSCIRNPLFAKMAGCTATIQRHSGSTDRSVCASNSRGWDIMQRTAKLDRKTKETEIRVEIAIDGSGLNDIATGIGFFDHMLESFAVHGFFDLEVKAVGDIHVDYHHTVEDVGLVLGDAMRAALGDKKGIVRYGHAVCPMDDALSSVTVDFSGRPFLVYRLPETIVAESGFNVYLAREFFRALSTAAKMNLHINVAYGENEHHVIESVFKSFARATDGATRFDPRIPDVHSSKGTL